MCIHPDPRAREFPSPGKTQNKGVVGKDAGKHTEHRITLTNTAGVFIFRVCALFENDVTVLASGPPVAGRRMHAHINTIVKVARSRRRDAANMYIVYAHTYI